MKYGILILSALLFFSCQEKYIIKGSIENLNDNMVYMYDIDKNVVDSTQAKSGTFTFTGSVQSPGLFILRSKVCFPIDFFLENCDYSIQVKNRKTTVDGGLCQSILNQYQDVSGGYTVEAFRAKRNSSLEEYFRKIDSLKQDLSVKLESVVKQYPSNAVSAYYILKMKNMLGFENINNLYSLLDTNMQNTYQKQLKKIVLERYDLRKGKKFPNLLLLKPNNHEFSIYSVDSKYKLIDFWSSSCKPCRKKNIHLKEIYQELKDNGLEIVSITVDAKEKAWLKALEQDQCPWVQTISPDKDKIKDKIGISAIPRLIVLDENNVILSSDFTGDILEFVKSN